MTPTKVLEGAFAQEEYGGLTPEQGAWVRAVVENAPTQKAVLAVLLTSLVKKIIAPEQDVRLHKVVMPGGYSGRSFDTAFVTPFIAKHFPRLAMQSGSGWLTRSLEQDAAFTLSFPGKIQNVPAKQGFLAILDDVETNKANPQAYLVAALAALKRLAQETRGPLAVMPEAGTADIATVIALVSAHIFASYKGAGASRLPVLALFAVYELLIGVGHYANKRLLPLKAHTTSDGKSRSLGNVEIVDETGAFYETVEVKHKIAITPGMVQAAFDKFRAVPLRRYYLLTTAQPNVSPENAAEIATLCREIRNTHGCEVIVNGLVASLRYYLRLVENPGDFLSRYTQAIETDFAASTDIKETHREKWRELLATVG